MSTDTGLPIAAIVYTSHGAADPVLAEFARGLRARGRAVRGLLQEDSREPDGTRRMTLVDLESGARFDISQKLGAGSSSSCVDPGGLAAASGVLRRALADGADLVIVSRFGEVEALGGGFAAEMLDLMGEGIPLLTAVGAKHAESWRKFTGGAAAELPADLEAVEKWFAQLPQASQ